MDAAYDAQLFEETSLKFGHDPIVDGNGRGKEVVSMAPHEAEHHKIRSCAERANSRMKIDFGANLHPCFSLASSSVPRRNRSACDQRRQ